MAAAHKLTSIDEWADSRQANNRPLQPRVTWVTHSRTRLSFIHYCSYTPIVLVIVTVRKLNCAQISQIALSIIFGLAQLNWNDRNYLSPVLVHTSEWLHNTSSFTFTYLILAVGCDSCLWYVWLRHSHVTAMFVNMALGVRRRRQDFNQEFASVKRIHW